MTHIPDHLAIHLGGYAHSVAGALNELGYTREQSYQLLGLFFSTVVGSWNDRYDVMRCARRIHTSPLKRRML